MNLFNIAVKNIKKNMGNYFLYFISMVCSIMVFYTLKAIQYNQQIMDLTNLNQKVENAFSMISIVIALFVFVFIWYSNSFFVGKRKKEVALYCLMGIKKSQVARMLFYENLIMGIMALAAGMLSGILFSKLFSMVLVTLMGFEVRIALTVPVEAILYTTGVFLALFAVTSLHGYMLIYKFQLIDLFKSESIGQKQPRTSFVLTLAAIVFIGIGYYMAFHFKYNGLNSILLIVLLTVCGTYLLFSSLVVYSVKFMKKRKRLFFSGLNMVTFSHLIFRSRNNSRLLATIAVLSACTITAVGAAAALYYDSATGLDKMLPFGYAYEIKDASLDQRIEEVIANHRENRIKDSLAIEVKRVEADYPVVDKLNAVKKGYEKSVDNVISISSLKKILASLGKKMDFSLGKDEVLMYFYTMYSEDVMENPKGKTMYYNIGGTDLPFIIKDCINYPVINELFNGNASAVNVIAVSDEVYAELADKTPPVQLRLINIENPRNSRDTTEDVIKTMSQSKLYNQNTYGRNAINISAYYDEYYNLMTELGMMIFLISFVGIIFLVCTGSMIFFKQLSEADDDRGRYQILKKIGVYKKEIRHSVAKQMSIIFGLPLLIGISHSLVALRILEPIIKASIWYPVLAVVAIYVLIYFTYYLLTVKFYCNLLSGQRTSQ